MPCPGPCGCNPPNTTVSGTIRGCLGSLSNLGSGNVVTITLGGSTLGTGTTNSSGAYSISFYLASNATVTIQVVPASTRLATTSTTSAITAGATNSGRNLTATPATGYACVSGCNLPILKTLSLTSSDHSFGLPDDTLTYQSSPPAGSGLSGSGWSGTSGAVVLAGGNPLGAPAGNYTYWMGGGPLSFAFYIYDATSNHFLNGISETCPTAGGVTFSATTSASTSNIHIFE